VSGVFAGRAAVSGCLGPDWQELAVARTAANPCPDAEVPMRGLLRALAACTAVAILQTCAYGPFAETLAAQQPKAVLVTGASSGIGKRITELLASKSHFIYAGARKDEDLRAVNAIANVHAVRLDVTKQAEIDAAVETVRRAGRGLHGLVNNAGVAVSRRCWRRSGRTSGSSSTSTFFAPTASPEASGR
jgi:NADPH:quinone reductase-like Zn-dependent oxidoreductase